MPMARFGREARSDAPATASGVSGAWHAHSGAAAAHSELILHGDYRAAEIALDAAIDAGASLEALCREVFEPAARYVGSLWSEDRCNEADVAMALGRLQLEVRQMRAACPEPVQDSVAERSVLLAPLPGEAHMLGAAMGSELFWRSGWCVNCEFPGSVRGLRALVSAHWFDVLVLSLSSALRREERLADVARSIQAAQKASRNPRLAVIVDGRLFFERPLAYREVGADGGCASTSGIVAAAERLLRARVAH